MGTRTHRQVSQLTSELKRTAYRATRMTVLASREQTCIHAGVRHLSSNLFGSPFIFHSFRSPPSKVAREANKTEACRKLLENMPHRVDCSYYRQARQVAGSSLPKKGAWDLEDLVQVGRRMRGCPYYATRELLPGADIVFCPYNYLIDPIVRAQMEISLKNAVIILDEAHNMEVGDEGKDRRRIIISERYNSLFACRTLHGKRRRSALLTMRCRRLSATLATLQRTKTTPCSRI